MSFFLALSQIGFLKYGYLSTLHEFFTCYETNTKSKKIHVEYVGSGRYVGVFDVTSESQLYDLIPENHLAFHGHNGPQIHDLCNIQDQDTITIRKQVFCGELTHTLEGHTYVIYSVAWNSQGLLASGSSGKTIKIWDSKTWKCVQTLEGHTDYVSSVAWNTSQTLLTSGSWDKTIRIWDTNTWICIHILEGHTQGVRSVTWNSHGTKLASGSMDNMIRIWNTKTWECIHTLEGHTASVYSVAWNSQGTLVSGSGDTTIKIWK